jgi:hypothetical protein
MQVCAFLTDPAHFRPVAIRCHQLPNARSDSCVAFSLLKGASLFVEVEIQ